MQRNPCFLHKPGPQAQNTAEQGEHTPPGPAGPSLLDCCRYLLAKAHTVPVKLRSICGWSYASLCAGSDSEVHCLNVLRIAWEEIDPEWFAQGPIPRFVHSYSVERDERKRSFIKALHKPQHLYCDMRRLISHDGKAVDMMCSNDEEQLCLVEPTHMLFAGTPCKNFSALCISAQRASPSQLRASMSGSTLNSLLVYIAAMLPTIVLLENVVGIDSHSDSSSSVLSYVLSCLETMGYVTFAVKISPWFLKSPQKRMRWWFGGYRCPSEYRAIQRQLTTQFQAAMTSWIESITVAESELRFHLNEFLLAESDAYVHRMRCRGHATAERRLNRAPSAGSDPQTRTLSSAWGQKWRRCLAANPASEEYSDTRRGRHTFHSGPFENEVRQICYSEGAMCQLSSREREMLKLQLREYAKHQEIGSCLADDFPVVDVTQSDTRLRESRYGAINALTEKDKYFIVGRLRCITGLEKMAVQCATPPSMLLETYPRISEFDDLLLANLAGNAFSSPVFLAAFIGMLECIPQEIIELLVKLPLEHVDVKKRKDALSKFQ